MKITWRRRKMKCGERSGVAWGIEVGRKESISRRNKRVKSGSFVRFGRKSPPLQTKGGAPSSSDGGGATGAREEKRSEESLGVSGRWRRLRLRLVLLVWRGRGALLRCRDSA